ncbi:MAG: hypothetical protein ABJH08_05985 [Balneola sp.]
MNKNELEKPLNGAIKIGRKDHINALQKEGHLYCNSVKYFRLVEQEDFNRHDAREGAYKTKVVDKPEEFNLYFEDERVSKKIEFMKTQEFDLSKENFKLFCLFGVKRKHAIGKAFVDKKALEFGEKALLITDLIEFIERVKSSLHELNIDFKWGHVKYYKESGVNENLTEFDKPDIFEHQNEFRLLIKEKSITPFSFKIGSIEDISILYDTNDLKKITLLKQ